jgi:hypothetical protein
MLTPTPPIRTEASVVGPGAPWRDDTATMACPVCHTRFARTGRQRYCTASCRKKAFRRRRQDPTVTVVVPAARPRRQFTVYECPDCAGRLLGEQRCPDCAVFARRVGIGGSCPHCDQPVALADLVDPQVAITTQETKR